MIDGHCEEHNGEVEVVQYVAGPIDESTLITIITITYNLQ